jgi:phosphoribosylformylglycinamidine (FGAM) synthase-like amidotransferase family enzyme
LSRYPTIVRPLVATDPYTENVAASAPRIAVVQFPGTNCERETARALRAFSASTVEVIWHALPFPDGQYDVAVLPGGFAHGDHLRAGAIARFSPVMP